MPTYTASEPSNRPDAVDPGEYQLEIVNAEESVSQAGNDMIELKLRVEPAGAILYDNLVFTPRAFWKIDSFRSAIGDTVTPGEEVDVIADELIGRRGRARLSVEEFGGRKRNRVAAWLPAKPTQADPSTQPF